MTRLGYTSEQFGDVCSVLFDLADELPAEERDLRQRILDDERAGRGFPARASGADNGGGGATNVVHDFGTDAAPDLQTVPQHSDPVGELVANAEQHTDPLVTASREAWRHVSDALRSLEAARSAIAQTRPPVVDDEDPDDRGVCWSCRRANHPNAAVYRDSDAGGRGAVEPRCRNCYDWACTHNGINPPRLVVETWADGRRLTTKIVDAARRQELDERARKKTNKKTKKRKR